MTRVRRVAAIALCAGVVVALAGQLNVDLRPGGVSLRPATSESRPASASPNQAAASAPTVDEQGRNPVDDREQGAVRMVAAQDLLSARAAAVKAGDKGAWMATVDSPGSAFGRRQSVAFDNLIKLPIGDFSYGAVSSSTVPVAPALRAARAVRARQLGPGAWVATVPGAYSLIGFDREPRSFEVRYTLVQRPGGWRIADDTASTPALQLWDLPGLRVVRGRSGIVIGNAPQERMRDYSALADSAVRRVSGVWGTDWNSRAVVVTPSTTEEFARLLLRPADRTVDKELDQVAAVAQGVIGPGQQAQGDQIVVNPKAFTVLQPDGRRVVITHEMTHVAVRSSTTRPVPIWLSEGMADYVGYSGLNLARERVAGELLTLVRAGKGPKALPVEADFDPSRSRIAPSYSGSWLAVARLADVYGQARVVAFYRAIAVDQTVDHAVRHDLDTSTALAFSRIFGVTEPAFVEDWKRYVRALAQGRG